MLITLLINQFKTVLNCPASATSEPAYLNLKENRLLPDENGRQRIVFYATFELSDGVLKKYRVSFWQYHQLKLGTKGTLRVQGNSYKSFKPSE